ncbi:calcium-dependent mitochondrial ATP-magnesium/phosphate carrier protein 1-like [Carex rostrata]
MVSPHDPIEVFLQSVKDALSPLSSSWSHMVNSADMVKLKHRPKLEPCNVATLSVATSSSSPASSKTPIKSFLGSLFQISNKRDAKEREGVKRDGSECINCLQFAVTWSVLVENLVQSFPRPFKSVKKCFGKQFEDERKQMGGKVSKKASFGMKHRVDSNSNSSNSSPSFDLLSIELLLCLAIESFSQTLQNLDDGLKANNSKCLKEPPFSKPEDSPSPQFDHLSLIKGLINGRKVDFDGFMSNLLFARVGGAPTATLVGPTESPVGDDADGRVSNEREEGENGRFPQNFASGLLNIPLSNVEKLRSTISGVSLAELVEFIPNLGKSGTDHPDKKKLFSVQDFFRYTETEGRRFFEELDRDGDGHVTLDDLEVAMRKRNLPKRYAKDLLHRTRSNLFSKSIGWKQFLSLMEQKEATILRAYTTLCLSKSGTLQKNQILTSLKSAGLPANEDNAAAMIRYLNQDKEGSISYGHFRNFMLLLPSERLEEDPRSIWFEAATVVAVPPPVEIAGSVLKAALAGGLACALSTSVMHPIDTMKTRVQASTLSFPELISKLPEIGVQGLYRGSIPAILGQFSSHGLRTGIFEASRLLLVNIAPNLPEIQVQSMASFASTILGTAVRIPCEVLKQRLQAGLYDNVGQAIVGTWGKDGMRGFFRGTGATLCREVPFYVAGMCLYAEAKKGVQHVLRRELEPWETVAVGALSGGLAAVVTTPFDVMKTRMMTAPQGIPISMQMIAFSILRKEGPLGLFKGAVPRFFWIAPLGAMNFAGYELAKKAMDKSEKQVVGVAG